MISANKKRLKESTQADIVSHFTKLASTGFDVQDFDPNALYKGTKKSLAYQRGYYKDFDICRIHTLTIDLKEILESNHEHEVLEYLRKCKKALTSKEPLKDFPHLQVIQFLPKDFFEDINPENMVAPNGLRIPESISQPEYISCYLAKLLVPKLLLSAINGLQGMVPWTDIDMDLNSTIHVMRPDPGKNEVNSGYGGGTIMHHTDGYWNMCTNIPLLVVVMSIANPFHEPTSFIPVPAIFQILSPGHTLYSEWVGVFSDLLKPNQSPSEFIQWIVKEAQKPQFNFVMGIVGGDASRGVYSAPLLEYHSHIDSYLFRAKSTFYAENEEAKSVVFFVNRMIQYLSNSKHSESYYEQTLETGEIYFSLNGSGLKIDLNAPYDHSGIARLVTGLGCIHGRGKLRSENNFIKRTLVRSNGMLETNRNTTLTLEKNSNIDFQPVIKLLSNGFRANNYCR